MAAWAVGPVLASLGWAPAVPGGVVCLGMCGIVTLGTAGLPLAFLAADAAPLARDRFRPRWTRRTDVPCAAAGGFAAATLCWAAVAFAALLIVASG